MIQDQLIEYISSQTKLGVSRDAIKSALVGVGWQAVDIEDTLKKIESDKAQPVTVAAQAQPVAQKSPVQTMQSTPSSASTSKPLSQSPLTSFSPSDIVGGAKSMQSQPVRMGDFVSSTAQSSAKDFFDKKPTIDSNTGKTKANVSEYPQKTKGGKVMTITEGVIIVGLAALSGFLYFQKNTLSAKINALGGQSSDVTSQAANLTAQIQTLTSSNSNLTTQVTSLTSENADLQANISFLAVPTAGPSSTIQVATTTTVQVSGILGGGGKSLYTVMTTYGVKVSVKNSSDIRVSTALTPLVGTQVQLSGTHLSGSALLTVSDINGSPLQDVSSTPAQSTSSTTVPTPAPTTNTSTTPTP